MPQERIPRPVDPGGEFNSSARVRMNFRNQALVRCQDRLNVSIWRNTEQLRGFPRTHPRTRGKVVFPEPPEGKPGGKKKEKLHASANSP